jgi:hypothetical protein
MAVLAWRLLELSLPKGLFMAETTKYHGLCETCMHDSKCTLRRSAQLRIIRCEDFKDHRVARDESGGDPDPGFLSKKARRTGGAFPELS